MTGLDGIRAVAVAAVLLFHADVAWIPGGFLGVDIFFVLSGYLITSLLLDEYRRTRTLKLAQFYVRRARRLLPALFLVLAACITFTTVFLREELTSLRSDTVASLVYVQNWWFVVHERSYFEAAGRPPMLQHLWSLALEEQFYLLWPLLLLALLRRGGKRRALKVAVVGAVVSATLMALLSVAGGSPVPNDASRVYFGTDTHASAVLLGAAAALVWTPRLLESMRLPGQSRALDLMGVIGAATVGWFLLKTDDLSPFLYRGGFFLCAAATVLVVVAAAHPRTRLSHLFSARPLRWLGERSYGVYLWHWPVFVITRPELDVLIDGVPLFVLRIGLTLGLADLSYRFVEVPIRRGRARATSSARRRDWRRAITAVATATVLGATGALVAGAANANEGGAEAVGGSPAEAAPAVAVPAATEAPTAEETESDPAAAGPAPGTSVPAQGTPAPAVSAPSAPVTPAGSVFAIGDSVMLSAAQALTVALGDVSVDAAVSRQAGRVLELLQQRRAGLPGVVVVQTGNNGPLAREQLDGILTALADRQRVVLVTVKVPRPWESRNNDMIRAAASRPNVVLADWKALAQGHPDWFANDGLHPRAEGQRAYADLVKEAIAR